MRNMRRDRRQRRGWTPRRPFRKIAEARRACCAGAWNRHHRPSQWGYQKPVMGVPTQHCSMKECEFWETHFEFKTPLLRLNFKIDFTSLLNSLQFRSILPLHLWTWRLCVLWIPRHKQKNNEVEETTMWETPDPTTPTLPHPTLRIDAGFNEIRQIAITIQMISMQYGRTVSVKPMLWIRKKRDLLNTRLPGQ